MKIVPVKHANYDKLKSFLEVNESLDRRLLFNQGYVVEIDGKIEGSFLFDELNQHDLWLKQLYITSDKAQSLPVLLEMILQIAKQKEAKTVYVHSHQPVVDILLEALQFQPEKNNEIFAGKPAIKGCWWSYEVS